MKNLSRLTAFQGSVLFVFPQYQSVNTGRLRNLVLLYSSNNKQLDCLSSFLNPGPHRHGVIFTDWRGCMDLQMAVCLFSWLQPTSLFLLRHFSYLFLNNLVLLWCIRWASEQLPGAPWSIWGQSKEQAGLNVHVSLNRLTYRAQWPIQHLHCQVAAFIISSPEHCGGLTLASCFPTPWERDPIAAVCWVPDGCQRVDLSAGLGNWVVPTLKD